MMKAHRKRIQNSLFRTHQKQRGLVMLMVVGVVVLMITLLALMLEDQHILIRQIGNQRVVEQSQQYSLGLNAWALRVLHEDANRQVDHDDEKWAKFGRPEAESDEDENSFSLDSTLARGKEDEKEDPKIDFGLDSIHVSIEDLQGKFNLNNLIDSGPKAKPKLDQKQIFLNLLQILEVAEYQEDREELYAAVVDWLDENDTYSSANAGRGAESGDYQIKSTPYFAGDQPLSNLGELKYVKGFNKKTIAKLRPYVTVLPVHNAKLNLNSVKTQVLASLAGGTVADTSPAAGFLARKEQPGFQGFQGGDIQSALTAVNGVSPGSRGAIKGMLQVNSQFFQINTKVELGDSKVCTRTIVLRQSANPDKLTDQTISVLSREQDTVCKEEAEDNGAEEPITDENLR